MLKHFIQQLLRLLYPFFKKLLPYQVFAYLAVGAANTILNIGLFVGSYRIIAHTIQVSLWGLDLNFLAVEIATIISFLLSVGSGFWLSKTFAFTDAGNEKKDKAKQFGKYFIIALQGQFSDYLITKGLIIFLDLHPDFAYLISTAMMLLLNYFLQKYYTFKVKLSKA